MHRVIVGFLIFCLLGSFASLVRGDNENISRLSQKTMFSGEVVAPGASVVSSVSMQAIAASTAQTIQWSATAPGGTANMAIVALCSVDGVTFYQPTTGGTITTFTELGGGIAPLAVPMCREIKLKLCNLSSNCTKTVSVEMLSQ